MEHWKVKIHNVNNSKIIIKDLKEDTMKLNKNSKNINKLMNRDWET